MVFSKKKKKDLSETDSENKAADIIISGGSLPSLILAFSNRKRKTRAILRNVKKKRRNGNLFAELDSRRQAEIQKNEVSTQPNAEHIHTKD